MEFYRVGGMPNPGLPQSYTQSSRIGDQVGNGTYGLSIRVQGIDGHPYVVLNNQDRGTNPYEVPQNNNRSVDSKNLVTRNYEEYEFTESMKKVSEGTFLDYRPQKQQGGPQNETSDPKKQSTVLNFQKHPELLKPYDPESNTLDSFRRLSTVLTRNPYPGSLFKDNSPAQSQVKTSSLDHSIVPDPSLPEDKRHAQPQVHPQTLSFSVQSQTGPSKDCVLVQPQVKPQDQTQPQIKPSGQPPLKTPVPYQTQTQPSQHLPVPQVSVINPYDQTKLSCRPPSSVSSTNSSLERSRHEPDVLPLRRIDSSGPVLQSFSSRKSSRSSTTSTKEDQFDQLYAEAINRHENRRYIPFLPGTGRDIDSGPIPGVDELIKKFDSKDTYQRRGRIGRWNRLNPEDRKRSRSVDSALPFGLGGDDDYLDEVSRNRGRSTEHLLRPSLLLQKSDGGKVSHTSLISRVEPRTNFRKATQISSAPGSPEATVSNSSAAVLGFRNPLSHPSIVPVENKNEETKSSQSMRTMLSVTTGSISRPAVNNSKVDAQVKPDLLRGQQELPQQTNEETDKQILFSYLKDGNTNNDDRAKRTVNLVFEKIQTLKSRAAGGAQGDNNPPDLAAQARALQEQKADLEKEIVNLKKQLEDESKKHSDLSETQWKAGVSMKDSRRELDQSQAECARLRDKLSKTEADLCTTMEELYLVKTEKEQYQTEIRDLQDQLSEMHDELDEAKRSQTNITEKEAMMADMKRIKLNFQELHLAKEEQEEVLRKRERELTALKGALKEEVATHDQEVDKLREQYENDLRKLQTAVKEAKQNNATVGREKEEVEAARKLSEGQAARLSQEVERLRRRVQELKSEVEKLHRIINDAKLQENRLEERASCLEKEKRQLEESLAEVREQEEEMTRANRALSTRLEDMQRKLTSMTEEHHELQERLKEERSQKEQFKSTNNEIEDERKLLDRTVEKLQREMNKIVEASRSSTQGLQEQIDMYKEKNRREMAGLHKQLREGGLELEKSHLFSKTLQEELAHMQEELRRCHKDKDDALQRAKDSKQKVFDLEVEADTKAHSNNKSRQVKLLEDRVSQLEMELEEERQSGDMLMERVDRGREQLEQMRNELMQERASRQDLEGDKIALERQNKDLKSRITYLEGSQKPSKEGLVAQLENHIQELEERLEAEERDQANLQLANRRLERRVKETMMQVDEDHQSLQDQKDQLNLRLKALKRQMDEAEEEIDRLEHSKKKLQRDLEEQQEANEQLQNQLKSLRSEIRRKSSSAPVLNADDDDDDVSTDGEMYFSSSCSFKRSCSQDVIFSL